MRRSAPTLRLFADRPTTATKTRKKNQLVRRDARRSRDEMAESAVHPGLSEDQEVAEMLEAESFDWNENPSLPGFYVWQDHRSPKGSGSGAVYRYWPLNVLM